MCGRARLITDYSDIRIELNFDDEGRVPNYAPRWNIAPSQDLLVAVRDAGGKRRPVLMRWGLIPGWAKDTKIAFSTFNARAESVTTKPAFRGAWKAGRRCLVVTDGFYEWRKSDKQPFAVAMADGKPMVMAGLYEDWVSPGGETIRSVTIITTDANAALAPVHHAHARGAGQGGLGQMAGRRAGQRRGAEGAAGALPARGAQAVARRPARRQCEKRGARPA